MDSRPATQASKGRHLLRSAIAEAVASDPAQRGVASIGAPGWRSRTPIWVGLGAVVALTAAVIIGTMLRTGTPGGVTSATSAPAAAATPSAQAPAIRAQRRAGRAPAPPPHRNPRQHLGQGCAVRERRQLGHQHGQRLPRRTAVHRIDLAFLRRLGYAAPGQPYRADRCRRTRARRPRLEGLARLLPQARPALINPARCPSRCQDRDAAPQMPRAPLIAEPRHLAVVLPEFGPSGSAQQDQRSCDERPGSLPAAVAQVPEDAEPLLTSGEVARRLGVTPAGGGGRSGGWWSAAC